MKKKHILIFFILLGLVLIVKSKEGKEYDYRYIIIGVLSVLYGVGYLNPLFI